MSRDRADYVILDNRICEELIKVEGLAGAEGLIKIWDFYGRAHFVGAWLLVLFGVEII